MMHIYNFAFGSNNIDQMNDRISKNKDGSRLIGEPEVVIKDVICLSGYEVRYNKWSKNRNAYVANLVRTDNDMDKVHGSLYELTDEQFRRLHRFEGVNEDGSAKQENGYEVVAIPVFSSTGEQLTALVYQAPIRKQTVYSVVDYLNRNLKAYLDNYYPKDYIDKLFDVPVVNHAVHKNKVEDKSDSAGVKTIAYGEHPLVTEECLLAVGYDDAEANKIITALSERDRLLEIYNQRFVFSQLGELTFLSTPSTVSATELPGNSQPTPL